MAKAQAKRSLGVFVHIPLRLYPGKESGAGQKEGQNGILPVPELVVSRAD